MPDREIIFKEGAPLNFEQKFKLLSNPPESVKPIESVTDEDVMGIRSSLEEVGCNFEITAEAITSLKGHQIRNINQGRGEGVVAVTGPVRAQELFDKCEQIAINHNWTQRFPSGGLGVRLKHTLADIIAICVLPKDERQGVVDNINRRVLRGFRTRYKDESTPERQQIELAFTNYPTPPNKPTQSTNPPESMMDLWTAMTSK